jgi:hypothetical protein
VKEGVVERVFDIREKKVGRVLRWFSGGKKTIKRGEGEKKK